MLIVKDSPYIPVSSLSIGCGVWRVDSPEIKHFHLLTLSRVTPSAIHLGKELHFVLQFGFLHLGEGLDIALKRWQIEQ